MTAPCHGCHGTGNDPDGSIGAPMAGFVCGEDGHPRLDCSECGTRVCHVNVIPGDPDAVFIAESRTAVPRLLAEREALRAEVERLHGQAKVEDVFYLDMCQERDHERAMCAERTAERDRARGTAAAQEAENARLREGIESMMRGPARWVRKVRLVEPEWREATP